MSDHWSLSDDVFIRQFADKSMNPEIFTHEAHLRLTWILLRNHDLITAQDMICAQIQNFDSVHGDGTKFDDSLTRKCVALMDHLMEKYKNEDLRTLLNQEPSLISDLKGLLATFKQD